MRNPEELHQWMVYASEGNIMSRAKCSHIITLILRLGMCLACTKPWF